MGSFARNSRVLKLVHPGGFLEMHEKPITTAEVMEKNPRHCVTRPDVFKFPWIVVRPESVLKPGGVFYVVPFHTIHRLLQFHGAVQNQQSLWQCKSAKPRDHHDCTCVTSLVDSYGSGGEGSCLFRQSMKSKSQKNKLRSTNYGRFCGEGFPLMESPSELTHFHCCVEKNCSNASQKEENCKYRDFYDGYKVRSKYNLGPESNVVYLDKTGTYLDQYLREQTLIKSCVKLKTIQDKQFEPSEKQYLDEIWLETIKNSSQKQQCFKQCTPIKSCLKNGNRNVSKLSGLRVKFTDESCQC